MALNLREFFTPAAVAAQWNEVASNYIDYIGPGLFPAKKKAGLDLSWIKGANSLPISLMPTAFDAKTTFRDRIGFEKMDTEMPFFREGFLIKEKDRQDYLRAKDTNDPYAQAVIDKVFDDANNLIAGAAVVPERMIFQLLFPENGNVGISIRANGVDYTYNYDPKGTWKASNYTALTGTDLWTAPDTSDPLKALIAAKKAVKAASGADSVVALMSSNTMSMITASAAIKARYLTTNGMSLGYITDQEAAAVVKGTTGLDIAVYDKQYLDESKAAHTFVPDGYVALLPAGTLGSTYYGTTPEEADLVAGANAEVSIVNTGVAISRTVETDPVNVMIKASEIVLPSYERMGHVAVLKVTA